ncbi:MAG: hypothetical protein MZU95_04090 [Desulfomicrobium escambiense]|nr:hypothetical protein [Desulfomicrobium escambiense]
MFQDLKKVEVIENQPTQKKLKIAIKVSRFLPLFRYTMTFDTSEKFKRVKFNKIEGSFKKLYGVYELEPYKNGTILTYKIFLDPGFYIPDFVSNSGVNSDLPDVLKSIRAKAECY